MPKLRMFLLVAFLSCVSITASFAQSASGMSYVLLPVFANSLPGAHGSTWQTTFAVYNAGPDAALYRPLVMEFPADGFAVFPANGGSRVPGATSPTGPRLFWIEASKAKSLHFSLRIRDLSRQSQSAGVDIPVVGETEFSQRVTLVDVPVDQSFRHSLRIYDPRPGDRVARLRISEFIGANPGGFEPRNPLVDEFVTLRGERDPGETIWSIPASLELHDLTTAYPQLARVSSLRIDVDPTDSDGKLWAFVAITNNTTQEVTVVTPQ